MDIFESKTHLTNKGTEKKSLLDVRKWLEKELNLSPHSTTFIVPCKETTNPVFAPVRVYVTLEGNLEEGTYHYKVRIRHDASARPEGSTVEEVHEFLEHLLWATSLVNSIRSCESYSWTSEEYKEFIQQMYDLPSKN